MPSATARNDGPSRDEIEVSVFSRGYGECIVVHAGDGFWIGFDSLLNPRGKPAALDYFQEIRRLRCYGGQGGLADPLA